MCGVPQPRLVCAEATNSKAVVIARLVRRRFVPSETDSDLNIYSLKNIQLIRGNIAQTFVVNERNDSGRSGVHWIVGEEYLLFVSYNGPEHAYTVEGCSNSDFLSKSSKNISEVMALSSSKVQPIISGLVSNEAWSDGISDAEVIVSGPTGIFRTRSGSDGRFELRVHPGTYSVTASAPAFTFTPGIFSYEKPDSVTVQNGTCAQVHLEGHLSKRP